MEVFRRTWLSLEDRLSPKVPLDDLTVGIGLWGLSAYGCSGIGVHIQSVLCAYGYI